ncbi:hypothetical protein CY35_01G106300 [Sphagnum magellanicum]|nr:hypothetical protein CY35_01G106300 [Sphagnum magellanicum]
MAWYITIFGPNIAEECYKFYAHMVGLTIRISEPETCSLHVATPLLKMPILLEAIKKSFPKELHIQETRSMDFYIGGETHGNAITLSGRPHLILQAAKSIPKDMVGRTSLRFQSPSKTTFVKVFSVTQSFGVDLEKNALYLVKNMKKLKLALEYFTDLSDTAFIPWNVPREITELVVPSKPF